MPASTGSLDGQTTLDVPNRHVDAGVLPDWFAVRANEEVVIIHEPDPESTTTYTLGAPTDNPRTLSRADAILWNGSVVQTHYEDGAVILSHMFGGSVDRLHVTDRLDDPVPTLERTERISLRGNR
jgi:hypothetical protein